MQNDQEAFHSVLLIGKHNASSELIFIFSFSSCVLCLKTSGGIGRYHILMRSSTDSMGVDYVGGRSEVKGMDLQ